jgi:hypothetical protein
MKAVLIAIVLAGCQKSQPPVTPAPGPTPTAVAPTSNVASTILMVSKDGEELGTITIVRGELGTLNISGAIAAKWLTDAWAEVTQRRDVRVHEAFAASDDGQHGISEKVYKPSDVDYAVGVQRYLREKDFVVTIIAAAPSGSAG